MRTLFVLVTALLAGNPVDQGQPGNQGAWPVRVTNVVATDGGIPVNTAANTSATNPQVLVTHYTDGGCDTIAALANRKVVGFQNLSLTSEVYLSFNGSCPVEGASVLVPSRGTGVSGTPGFLAMDFGPNIPIKATSSVTMVGDAGLIVIQAN